MWIQSVMRKQALFAPMIEVATSIIWGESVNLKYVFLKAFFPCLAMSYLDSLEMYWKTIYYPWNVLNLYTRKINRFGRFTKTRWLQNCYRQRENVETLCTALKCKSLAVARKSFWCSFLVFEKPFGQNEMPVRACWLIAVLRKVLSNNGGNKVMF